MNITRIILAAALLFAGLTPVAAQSYHGISCDDVRALSSAERDYWSVRLNLSAAQRHRIDVSCLQNAHRGRGHTVRLIEAAANR
jgi:hypothetical protein